MKDPDHDRVMTRTEASQAVEVIGWRYLLGTLCASVPLPSFDRAVVVAAAAVEAAAEEADTHLRIDLRPTRVELSLQTRSLGVVTAADVELAHRISAAVVALELAVAPARSDAYSRPVSMLELAIDAVDIPAIRPFWKAALAYGDDPADPGPAGALMDPAGQQPSIWFQQMDQPRLERNRIHLDVTVANDEAEARVSATLAAGGSLVTDAYADMYWVLADAEGNECCVCTWTDRDEWDATH